MSLQSGAMCSHIPRGQLLWRSLFFFGVGLSGGGCDNNLNSSLASFAHLPSFILIFCFGCAKYSDDNINNTVFHLQHNK